MINVIIGEKGTGKTKYLVDHVNNAVKDAPGNIVFIGKTNRLMCDLKPAVRYITTEDFNISDYDVFFGFIGGIVSSNYDISHVFIDSIWKIVATETDGFESFISNLEKFSEKSGIDFTIAISAGKDRAPEYLNKFIVEF